MDGAPDSNQTRNQATANEENLAGQDVCGTPARETFATPQAKPGAAKGVHPSHPAVIALVRLLARQAAREALTASPVEQENQTDVEEDD